MLADAGAELVISSPKGGQPPVDPKSESPDAQTAATKRFYGDYDLIDKIAHTLKMCELYNSFEKFCSTFSIIYSQF